MLNPMPPPTGDGWRLLVNHEMVQEGDEQASKYLGARGQWTRSTIPDFPAWLRHQDELRYYRRRVGIVDVECTLIGSCQLQEQSL